MKAIDQHVTMSRPEIDSLLMTKLPEALTDKQKVSKIGHLLTALRMANEIVFGEKNFGGASSSLTTRFLREL